MNAKQLQPSSKSTRSTVWRPVWWAGIALALAATLAISVAMMASEPTDTPLTVPDAAAQSVYDELIAHGVGQYTPDQLAPEIVRRVARDQRRALDAGLASMPQTVPALMPVVINNHLYIPCSGGRCDPPPMAPDVARRATRDVQRAQGAARLDPSPMSPDIARRFARDNLWAQNH